MGTYQDKLAKVIALGDGIWVAEYMFNDINQANSAGLAVMQSAPRLVEQAKAGKADMVVAEFDDCSRLFFGGILDDHLVEDVHRTVLAHGGTFDVARQPPRSNLKLSPTGVEEGRAPTLVVEEIAEQPASERPLARNEPAYEPAKPWWKIWG